jgi:hypothetical protein
MKNKTRILFLILLISPIISLAQGLGIDTSDPRTKLDINGDFALRNSSITAVNGNNNNLNIGNSSFITISGPTATYNISGIAGGADGKMAILFNNTSFDMKLTPNTMSGSLSQNQILCPSNGEVTVKQRGCATLIYQSSLQKWVVISDFR